ncbi:hypothetical protein [Lactiplantibacillus paraxiangfangensis]|uniref:hypothetical protein n=1 Tax=Lactiplantibacillus paraxiangfangensis TaxID=3076224 RepID=UPI0030C77131
MVKSRSKKLITSFMLGAALMGTGLTAGLVYSNANQPVTAEAKAKTKKVVIKKEVWKDGAWHSLTVRVPYGKTITAPVVKYKGYLDIMDGGYVSVGVDSKGKRTHLGVNQYVFVKKLSAKTQKANAKSKKAVTANGGLVYTKGGKDIAVPYTVKGLVGTLVKTSVPKVAGYTSNATTMKIGILPKGFIEPSKYYTVPSKYIHYTKNSSFGYKATKVKATKSTKSGKLKVKGTFAIQNKKSANKHAATYAVITDYKGNTHVKLNSKKAFNKSIKKRAAAKKVTVMAAYRTKKHNSKSYTYHMLSVPKKVTVKATK